MKKILQLLIGMTLIMVWATQAFGDQVTERRRVLFLLTNPHIDEEVQQAIDLMHHNFNRYSRLKIYISTKTVEPHFFSNLDSQGERYIKTFFLENDCDYLMMMREVGQDDHLFELWSKRLMYNHIYTSYNDGMKRLLPDITANSFLSLLFEAEDRFWKTKLY